MEGATEPFKSEAGSYVSKKENSSRRIEIFLSKCFEKDIALEAFIASVLLRDNNAADIFASGMAKAAHFSEHGDIQAVLHAVTRWCFHLHVKSQRQLTNWCKRHGLREAKLKEIDQYLHRIHQTTISASEIPTLKFHKDVASVHDQMTGIMAKLWHGHLCVYRGHADLGYCHIASKTAVRIGKKSVSRLAGRMPSTFVLCFDDTGNSPGKVEANICVSVARETAESVLSEYYGTTVGEILARFCLVPVTVTDIGFELGSLASYADVRDQMKSTCDETTELFYDRHRKEFTIMCQRTNTAQVRSEFTKILERLRTELASQITEVPYPNLHSPLRLLIGEGLKCYGVSGFQWNFYKDLSNSHHKFFVDSSTSSETNRFVLCDAGSYQCEHRESAENVTDHYHINQQLVVTKATQNRPTEPTSPSALNHLKCNEVVTFHNAVNASMSMKNIDAKYLERQAEAGSLDPCVSNVRRISKSSSLGCENPDVISDDLRTIQILCREDLFARVEKSLIANLDALKRNDTIVSYKKTHISSHNEVHIQVIVTNRYQVPMTQEHLQNVIRPTVVVASKGQTQYLRRSEGQQFLNFLMDFTDTYIHFPESQKGVYIYGESSKQLKSRSILNRQLTSNPRDISWHVVDLGNGAYSSVSVKVWHRKIHSYINELKKCGGLEGEYVLLEDRPQFWVEATRDNFQNLVNKMESSVQGNVVESQADAISSSPVECSICFQQLCRSSDDCCLLSVCGHAYCRECLVQLVTVAANNHQAPIRCALGGCDKKLGASEFRLLCGGILASLNSRKLLRRLLMQFVADSSPSVRTCGNGRCAGVGLAYEAEGMDTCLWCCGRFCVRCGRHFHGDIPCGITFNMRDWLTERPNDRKRCPKCKVYIEKVEGCHCVHCAWCKSYFCWNCAVFHTKDHDNIYRHTNKCIIPS